MHPPPRRQYPRLRFLSVPLLVFPCSLTAFFRLDPRDPFIPILHTFPLASPCEGFILLEPPIIPYQHPLRVHFSSCLLRAQFTIIARRLSFFRFASPISLRRCYLPACSLVDGAVFFQSTRLFVYIPLTLSGRSSFLDLHSHRYSWEIKG